MEGALVRAESRRLDTEPGTRCLGPDIWAVFKSLRMMVGLRRGGNIATAIQELGRKAMGSTAIKR